MSKNASFRRGVDYFREAKYEDALEMFNEAARQNKDDKAVFDSRAAVFEKMDRLTDALRDSKRVIDLAPNSWQGYARSARLFMKLNKFDSAIKMTGLALERVNGADQKRRDELLDLQGLAASAREAAVRRAARRAYHFGKLPVEIASTVFNMAVEEDASRAVVLSHVCAHWRGIALGTPSLWRRLTLSAKVGTKEVDARLERSNGAVRNLVIRSNFAFADRPNILRKARASFWSRLESLKVEIPEHALSLRQVLGPVAFESLRLRSLELVGPDGRSSTLGTSSAYWAALDTVETGTIHTLEFTNLTVPWKWLASTTSLRKLVLQTRLCDTLGQCVDILRSNPFLETLAMDFGVMFGPTVHNASEPPVDMPCLTQLTINDIVLIPQSLFTLVRFPALTSLTLNHVVAQTERADRLLATVHAAGLTELRVHYCLFSAEALVMLLARAPLLTVFELSNYAQPLLALLDALAGRECALLCPALQHADFSRCDQLRAGSLVHLVKAHLPRITAGAAPALGAEEDGQGAATLSPIRSLIIDGCPLIDPEALPWLRANVERVSCIFMTRKQSKKTPR